MGAAGQSVRHHNWQCSQHGESLPAVKWSQQAAGLFCSYPELGCCLGEWHHQAYHEACQCCDCLLPQKLNCGDACSAGVPKEAWPPRSQPTHRVQDEMELQLPIPGKEPMISYTFISANKNLSSEMDVIGIKMLMSIYDYLILLVLSGSVSVTLILSQMFFLCYFSEEIPRAEGSHHCSLPGWMAQVPEGCQTSACWPLWSCHQKCGGLRWGDGSLVPGHIDDLHRATSIMWPGPVLAGKLMVLWLFCEGLW